MTGADPALSAWASAVLGAEVMLAIDRLPPGADHHDWQRGTNRSASRSYALPFVARLWLADGRGDIGLGIDIEPLTRPVGPGALKLIGGDATTDSLQLWTVKEAVFKATSSRDGHPDLGRYAVHADGTATSHLGLPARHGSRVTGPLQLSVAACHA